MLAYLIVVAFLPAIILGHHEIIACNFKLQLTSTTYFKNRYFTGPGNPPTPIEIRVEGCDASPCQISHGDAIPYEVDFVASKTSTTFWGIDLLFYFLSAHSTNTLTLAVNATIFGLEHVGNVSNLYSVFLMNTPHLVSSFLKRF